MSNYLLVGIKGTGMSSLALILNAKGNNVFGIDKSDYFSTQEKLNLANIKIYETFDINLIDEKVEYVIYSTAYENLDFINNLKKKYTTFSYIEYLTQLTKQTKAYAISGTHGKTTTAAATTFSLSYKERKAFPFYSIYGSSLLESPSFTYQGDEVLLLEACEYQNHFLDYELDGAIITSIDFDHPDFFKSIDEVRDSFLKFALNLKKNAFLILNIDDKNVKSLEPLIRGAREDLNIITYGFNDTSIFRITKNNLTKNFNIDLTRDCDYHLSYFNHSIVNDLVGSAILSTCILLDQEKVNLYLNSNDIICDEVFITLFRISLKSLESFNGVKGRLELKAQYNNKVFIDDYAHHPNEIYALLEEVKNRYPNRKVFAIFSFHTASRTKALYKDFLDVFLLFDKLIITKTFASARMDEDIENLDLKFVKDLNNKLLRSYKVRLAMAQYVDDINQVAKVAASSIEDDDIIVTLGASNNDELYKSIIEELERR